MHYFVASILIFFNAIYLYLMLLRFKVGQMQII